MDWVKIAKAAGEYGVRFRTNRALEAFMREARCDGPAYRCPLHPHRGRRMSYAQTTTVAFDRISKAAAGKDER